MSRARLVGRLAANTASALLLAAGCTVAVFFAECAFGPVGQRAGCLLVAAVLWGPRWIGGASFGKTLDDFARVPLVRGSRRLQALWGGVLAVAVAFWAGAFVPLLEPEVGLEGAIVETVRGGNVAFEIGAAPDDDRLVVTYAHQAAPGGVEILDRSDGSDRFLPLPGTHAHCATLLGDFNLIVVHDQDHCGGPPNTSRMVALDSGVITSREEPDFEDLTRSAYDPRTNSLYLMDKRARTLFRTTPEDFVAGRHRFAPRWAVPEVFFFEYVIPHPDDPDRVLARGEGLADRIVELDLRTGGRRFLAIPPVHWDMSLDPLRRRLYLTRFIGHTVTVVDIDRWEVVDDVWVGGAPRPVTAMPEVGAVAVGMYEGRRLVVLDAGTFRLRMRLRTCSKQRDLYWDAIRRDLWWTDVCGLHRARLAGAPALGGAHERAVKELAARPEALG